MVLTMALVFHDAATLNLRRRLHSLVVNKLYATHNRARSVRASLERVFAELEQANDCGLDLGSAGRQLHPKLFGLDICRQRGVDCVASAESLPFMDQTFRVLVTQEVFEHLSNPWRAMQEVARVMKPGGLLYFQVPFVIGYHPGPTDFWRFTVEGVREIIETSGLKLESLEISVGAGTGMYRIAVEFFAIVVSSPWRRLYLPMKGLAAFLCLPLRLGDLLARSSPQKNRIAGGYLAIARKPQ